MRYDAASTWDDLATGLRRRHIPVPAAGGRVTCEPGWTWQPTLSDYDLWLVLAGRGYGWLNGEPLSVRPGTLLVLRPGDTGDFHQHVADRLTVAYCHFDFVHPATRQPVDVVADQLPSRHFVAADVAGLSGLLQRVVRLARDPHPLRAFEAEAAFLSVLVEVYIQDAKAQGHAMPQVDPRLQDVIDFVRDQPRHRPSLAEAAAVARLSTSHLSRLFSRQLGVSFRAFVLETRLERAHTLLLETTMTVSDVAHALGYADVFLFSRQFRARYGQSPRQLRGV